MDNLLWAAGAALVVGLGLGYTIGAWRGKKTPVVEPNRIDWWGLRNNLTGTQLQILQYLESQREASISTIQDKFSFIPDRELYYRLEQIYLMGFLVRDRKDGDVFYTLNPEYSGTVEEDKTVMLSGDS